MTSKSTPIDRLAAEVAGLGRRLAELETSESRCRQLEQSLHDLEELHQTIADNLQDGLTVIEGRDDVRYINRRALEIFGYPEAEFVKMTDLDFAAPEERERLRRIAEDAEQTGAAPQELEFWIVRKDGARRCVRNRYSMFRKRDGSMGRLVVVADITEQKQAERALQEREASYSSVFHSSKDAMYVTARDGEFVDFNLAAADLFGYARDELMMLNVQQLYADPADRSRFQQEVEQKGSVRDYEVKFRRKDGTELDCLLTSTVRRAADGTVLGYHGIIIDFTERKRVEATIRQLAYYDPLTGLPNRVLFNDRLTVELARARRNEQEVAVMMLDLDRFKNVNDSMGHAFGDQLLKAIADRLTGVLRRSDTIARLGGDEFVLLLPEAKKEGVIEVARRILEAVRQPFAVTGHHLTVTTSIGIAIYPDDGHDAETLVKNADTAMYRVKETGRNNYQRFNYESAGSK